MTTHLSILPNWLGDLVMATPALRRFGAGVRHVVAGEPGLVELATDLGLCDDAVVIDRRGTDRSWRRWPSIARRLRAVDPARALVLGPSSRAAFWSVLSGAPERRGVGGEAREVFLTEVHRVPGGLRSRHLSQTWWEIAGGRGACPRPRWDGGPRARAGFDALAGEVDVLHRPYAVFAAGATYGPTKRWPEASFAEVARVVHDEWGWIPVLVGSGAEREVVTAERIAARSGGISLAGRTDLPTLVEVLRRARCFVGNDSGPMHVAAACGTPTVGVFGSTSPTWTAPRGEQAVAVGPAPVTCSPCFRSDCPYDLECLRNLEPATVLAALDRLLGAVDGEAGA